MTFLVKKLNPNILGWQELVLHCPVSLTTENPVPEMFLPQPMPQ